LIKTHFSSINRKNGIIFPVSLKTQVQSHKFFIRISFIPVTCDLKPATDRKLREYFTGDEAGSRFSG